MRKSSIGESSENLDEGVSSPAKRKPYRNRINEA